jgi:mRNA interferase MazF
METVFLCFQLRSLDPGRFLDKPEGRMSDDALLQVEDAVRRCLGL